MRSIIFALMLAAPAFAQTTNGPSLSPWDWGGNLRGAFGYKDNVLLSHSFPEGSPFFMSGAEVFALRAPVDGLQLSFFSNFENYQYWSATNLNQEQWVVSMLQLKHYGAGPWDWSMALDHAYLEQVTDVSVTETNLSTWQIEGQFLKLHPSLHRDLPGKRWAELELEASRQWLHEPLDSYWQFGPHLSFGQDYGYRSSLVLSYEPYWRRHDHRQPWDADGVPLAGKHLQFFAHEGSVQWTHYLDAAHGWRSQAKVSFLANLENGAGYFDYRRVAVSEALRYQAGSWQVSGRLRLAWYDFPHQAPSPTESGSRTKTTWLANLRVERSLLKHLKAFAQYEHEEALSNLSFDQYRVNQASAGIDWGF